MTAHEKLVIVRQLLAELRNESENTEPGASKAVIACHVNTIRHIANQVLAKYYPEYFTETETAAN